MQAATPFEKGAQTRPDSWHSMWDEQLTVHPLESALAQHIPD